MAGSEAARVDLYNGLAEILGKQRAETLMAALPSYDTSDLATRSDVGVLGARLDGLEVALGARIDGLEAGLGARVDGLEARVAGVESIVSGLGLRMDRMFLALIAGLIVIVATMAGVLLSL